MWRPGASQLLSLVMVCDGLNNNFSVEVEGIHDLVIQVIGKIPLTESNMKHSNTEQKQAKSSTRDINIYNCLTNSQIAWIPVSRHFILLHLTVLQYTVV